MGPYISAASALMARFLAARCSESRRGKCLSDLANVPTYDDDPLLASAERFIETWGPMLPGQTAMEIPEYARRFREAWTANTDHDMQTVSGFLSGIFATGDPITGDLRYVADFSTGKWEPVPRTPLDVLAQEVMALRKMLHRCERPECGRYFVKAFSRDRYCGPICGDDMRSRGQLEWARRNRETSNARRRKTFKETRKMK